jgi:hypothetical protein
MSTVAVWQGSDAELLTELSVIAEVDSRGTAAAVVYTTTMELVRAVGRVTRGEARAQIAAAADVLPTRGVGGAVVPRSR